MAKQVNDQNFQSSVLEAAKPVLVDFGAEWCGPCVMQAPILEEWAAANQDKVDVVTLDVDSSQAVAAQYGVMSIPTLILFHGGKECARAVGLQNQSSLDDMLAKASA